MNFSLSGLLRISVFVFEASMEPDTATLEAEILQLSRLSPSQLDDAALEIQVDLEMCWHDHRDLAEYPSNPYDEFLWFARRIADSSSECPEWSVLRELTHRQTYLAATWAFLTTVRDLSNEVAGSRGWSEHGLADAKVSFWNAALRLIDDAKYRPYALYHCGVRDEPMGEFILH